MPTKRGEMCVARRRCLLRRQEELGTVSSAAFAICNSSIFEEAEGSNPSISNQNLKGG